MILSTKKLLVYSVCWWFAVVALALNAWNPFGILWVIGTPFALLVPGLLTLLLAPSFKEPLPMRLATAVALSVFELLLIGLIANYVLPTLGVARPLDTPYVVWFISTLLLVLLTLTWSRIPPIHLNLPQIRTKKDHLIAFFIGVPIVSVLLSILGPLYLNQDGGNVITMGMLVLVAVYIALYMHFVDRLPRYIAPLALFCLGLSLLLMTSLRGWYISGHDIQREFYVFQLAKDAGLWSMEVYRDAYNACLSITILPTMLVNLLHIPDAYVYKVLMQVVFATSVVSAYYIARRFMAYPYAFLTVVCSMAFPTFFQDMPFLVRQEVAFLFFALMIYFLFNERYGIRARRVLFVLFGIGVLLSHYSTMYMVLAVFVVVAVCTPLARALWMRVRHMTHVRDSAIVMRDLALYPQAGVVTFKMVVVLMLATGLWTAVITDTDGHVRTVLNQTWDAILNGFDGNARSADALSVFSFGRVEQPHTLEEYYQDVVAVRREASPDEFYPEETYAYFPLVPVPYTYLPVTPFGAITVLSIVAIGDVVTFLGQLLAKVLQVGILVGLVYVFFRRTWIKAIEGEFVVLALASLAFVFACIALPLLSKEYGLFRALQQSLFVLAPFIVVGMLVIGVLFARVAEWWLKLLSHGKVMLGAREGVVYTTATILVVLFFLYTTGFMTQLVGGNVPAVHLNSVGEDYRHYVTEEGEYRAIHWLRARIEKEYATTGVYPLVQSDRFGEKKLQAYMRSPVGGDVYPGVIHKNAYVFVTPAMLYGGIASVHYMGDTMQFAYTMQFLDEQKELVYAADGVRIYK